MALNLSKEQATVQLKKRQEKVHAICLEKEPLIDLTARIAVILDISGSMSRLIESGAVQTTLERLLPIAMQFDDNREMEFWTFNDSFQRYNPINLNNFYDYIKNNKIKAKGGTCYAPVLCDICKYFMQEEPAKMPNYIIFITDGTNEDRIDTDEIIKFMSNYPIFIQFVGLGDRSFDYLSALDTMEGRYIDNANFFAMNNIHDDTFISDNELYHKLLAEYPTWLADTKVQYMINNADTAGQTPEFKRQMKKITKEKILNNIKDIGFALLEGLIEFLELCD